MNKQVQNCPLCGSKEYTYGKEHARCSGNLDHFCVFTIGRFTTELWNRIRIAPDDKEVIIDYGVDQDLCTERKDWMNPNYQKEQEDV